MAGRLIPCTSCGVSLKLRDSSLTGKRVKCPKCGARFTVTISQPVVVEPDEVPLQLVDPVIPARPMLGTSARWVPDGADPVLPLVPDAPSNVTVGDSIDPDLQNFLAADSRPEKTVTPFAIPTLAVAPEADSASVIDLVKARRRRSRRFPIAASLAVAVFAAICGSLWILNQQADVSPPSSRIQPNIAWQKSIAEQAASNDDAKALSPTAGTPIPTDYLPFTPHVLCHLHPAALWNGDRHTSELQALLSCLGTWLKEQIRLRTRFEPEEISELTFAINFGPRMSAPDVAAVVRLKSPQTDQELMRRFHGRIYADPQVELYEASDFSYLKIDEQTFVVAPSSMTESLAMSFNDPALLSPEVACLIRQSDRDRHLTLLFEVGIVDSHREDAFIEQMQTLADRFLFWFGKEVQTISWSIHLEPDFYMETLLHPAQASTPAKLQQFARRKLSSLPGEILSRVQMMRPATVGSRAIIGRFPAMLKAVEIGTTTHLDPVGVRLITLLPQQAASNLVAGTMLTWNQSLLESVDDDSHLTSATIETIPEKVVDRLDLKVLIDFRATPLREALSYIGECIKTEIEIDGDALKAAGFTQNMPQTYNSGSITARKAIDTIFQKYAGERDPLVLVIDEEGKRLLFSTVSKAQADGLTIFKTGE